jgi:hypothetical protein
MNWHYTNRLLIICFFILVAVVGIEPRTLRILDVIITTIPLGEMCVLPLSMIQIFKQDNL